MPFKDPEKAREWAREYNQRPEVIERIKQYRKDYTQRPKVRERNKKFLKEYRKRPGVRERLNKQIKEISYKVKYDALNYYSKILSNSKIPCCRCCGEHEFLIFLTIDHITNRKNVIHKKNLHGVAMYRYLRDNNYPSGYQVLCVNCNSAKSDSGICPHKRSNK